MEVKGFNIELVASSYTIGSGTIVRPFKVQMRADDPNLWKYESRAFKKTPCMVVGDPVIEKGTLLVGVAGIPKKHKDALIAAGYTTAEKIMNDDVTEEDLLAVKGIGDASLEVVLEACEKALEE